MQRELMAELEAQSELNVEWGARNEDLLQQVESLTAEVSDLRAENDSLRSGGVVQPASPVGVAEAVESVAEAASAVLERRAALLEQSQSRPTTLDEIMAEWRLMLDRSRDSWRSEPRAAAAVGSLGSALEVTLSTLQQLGSALEQAEAEVTQLSRDDQPPVSRESPRGEAPGALLEAQTEIARLRERVSGAGTPGSGGRHDNSAANRSGSTTVSECWSAAATSAEATAAAAAAQAQVGTLRASVSQIASEVDRLWRRVCSATGAALGDAQAAEPSGDVAEADADVTELRKVAESLRKLGECGAALDKATQELDAERRASKQQAEEIRALRAGEAAALQMHSAQEMAEKEAKIAELTAVRQHTRVLRVRAF